MEMKGAIALAPLLALALGACGPAISSANFMTVAPRPVEHEIALYSTKLPTCPYEEIGVVRGKRRALTSLQQVLSAIQQRARKMGGDAVVGLGQTVNVRGGIVVDNVVSVESQEGLTGTVIRFSEPNCVE
jgi:hypothetical protein